MKKIKFILLVMICISLLLPFSMNKNYVAQGSCSWKLLDTPVPMNPVYSIAIDPNNSDIAYLGTGGKIYKSVDGGNSWTTLNVGPSFNNVFSIVFDPSDSKILYIGGSGLYKSNDAGKSWIHTGMLLSEITKLVINPVNSKEMYAIDAGLLYESEDGGETWFSNPNFWATSCYDIALDSVNPSIVYMATNGGLLKKTVTNGLVNWETINGISSTKCVAIDLQNNNILYAATYSGVYMGIYKSINGGKNWFEIDNGISFSNNNKMADLIVIDPNNTNILYTLINGVGLYKSTDGGSNWVFIQDEVATNIHISTITIDPKNSDNIYIGAASNQNGNNVVYKHQCNVNYSLELSVLGQGKVLKNPDKDKYQEGESVILTAIPEEDWIFIGWSGDITSTKSELVIKMDSIKKVIANFKLSTYLINANADPGGSISPSGVVAVNQGDNPSFIITSDTGYHITDVKVDGVSVGAVSTYTFTNVTSNHSIEVLFEKNQQNIIVKLQIGNKIMIVNGVENQLDAAPEIKNGRTFLPLRAISEAFGAKVVWLQETQGITITLGDNTIGLQIGNTSAVVNGTVMTLEAAPYIKNSRTMVPLRLIAEGLGAQVDWDGTTRTVTLTITETNNTIPEPTNQLPIASFTMNPTTGTAPLEVTFNASSSYDPDGTIVSYAWDFEDGNSGSGVTVKHTFNSKGIYNIKLTVTDNKEATSSTIKTITITETITFCQIGVPYIADDGLTVVLNSLIITEKIGSYQYSINYTLTNNTADKAIDEGTFKMYYKNESGGLPQYGFFDKLFPGDTRNRTYTFEELKSKPFDVLEYSSDNFFSPEPLVNSLKWEVHVP